MTRQQGFSPEFMSQILKIIDRRRNSTEGRLHLTEKTFVLVTARNEKHPWDVMLASIVSLHEWTVFFTSRSKVIFFVVVLQRYVC